MAVAYWQISIWHLSLVGLHGFSWLCLFSLSIQFSFPCLAKFCLAIGQDRFFINQWYSQHTKGNPTSSRGGFFISYHGFKNISIFTCCFAHACIWVCVAQCARGGQKTTSRSLSLFHVDPVGEEDQTQGTRLGSKCLYLLVYLVIHYWLLRGYPTFLGAPFSQWKAVQNHGGVQIITENNFLTDHACFRPYPFKTHSPTGPALLLL